MDSMTGVQVVVRVRPLNNKEKQGHTLPIVSSSSQKKEVTLIKGIGFKAMRHTFNFDNVFNEFTTQQEVFEQTLAPLVSDVLKGFESTVFAYGQTGTGKTYTMEGEIDIPAEAGVIPRSCEEIFKRLTDSRYSDSSVRVSYLEIYNEELCDLLVDSSKANNLKICEDVQGKVICWGLSEVTVTSTTEVLEVLRSAQARRRVGETKMNKVSSRSHCLFSLSVTSKEFVDGGIIERRGKLHLVDLAGSECAKATGADANSTRLRESQNINKSLLTLGRVITSLRDKTARIPYRDSKLTRLLQEALGGHSKTCIIATLSPSVQCADETLSTLKYAEKAHGIENKASYAFVRMSATGEPLSEDREVGAGDARTFSEMEQRMHYMEMQCEEAQAALGRKHEEIAGMQERAEAAEEKIDGLMTSITETEKELKDQREANEAIVRQLETERMIIAQQKILLNARCETEQNLRREATDLLESLDLSVKNTNEVLSDLQERVDQQERMKAATRTLSADSNEIVKKLTSEFSSFSASLSQRQQALDKLVETLREKLIHSFSVIEKSVNENFGQTKEGYAKMDHELHAECGVLSEKVNVSSEHAKQQMREAAEKLEAKTQESLADLQKLQQLQQQAENEVLQWCEQTKKNLLVNSEEMEKNISLHHTTLTQQHEVYEKDYSRVMVQFQEQKEKLHSLLKKLGQHISAQNETTAVLSNTQECMNQGVTKQLDSTRQQQQMLSHALKEQNGVGLPLVQTHALTLSQALTAVKESAHAQLQSMSTQLASLSSAIQEHQETSSNLSSSHSSALSGTKTSLFTLISAQIESLRTQSTNLEDILNNENFLGSATKKEKAHLQSLQLTTQTLSSHVQKQLSLLAAQKEHLSRVICENLEKNTYEQQKQHASSLTQSRQHISLNVQQQLELLTHQKSSLESTLSTVRKGMHNNEQHVLSTLAQTEQDFTQHTSEQYALLEQQNLVLKAAIAQQQEGQALLIQNVMSGVQRLLTSGLSELENVFVGNMNTISAKNKSMNEEAKKMSEDFLLSKNNLHKGASGWVEHEKDVAMCVENITRENVGVATKVSEMYATAEENCDNLMKETETWGEHDREIARELKLSVEENSGVSGGLESFLAAFQADSAQLVAETQQWGHMNRAVAGRVESIQSHNREVMESEQNLHVAAGEHVDALSAESEQWTQSNAAVYAELQKSMESNQLLQAAARAAEAQHSTLLHTAATQTENLGKSCLTTVTHVQQALSENERSQELSRENLREVSAFIATAQNQIAQSVAETSGSISQEVNTLVSNTSLQIEQATSMQNTSSTNIANSSAAALALSKQLSTFLAQENESVSGLAASRASVSASYDQQTSHLSSQLSSSSQLIQTSAQTQAQDLSVNQQSVNEAIHSMEQKEVNLHRVLLESAAQSCSSVVTVLKEQGSNTEHTASAHHTSVQEAETELKQHTGTCSESVSTLSSRLGSFYVEDIAMHMPVDPAKVPSVVVFSRNLSQTPSEELLLGAAAARVNQLVQEVSFISVDEGSDENAPPDRVVGQSVPPVEGDPKKKRRAFSDIGNAITVEDHSDKLDKLAKKPRAGTLPRPSNMKPPHATKKV